MCPQNTTPRSAATGRRALLWLILLAVPVTATIAAARRAHVRRGNARTAPTRTDAHSTPVSRAAFSALCTAVHDGDSLTVLRGDRPIEVRIRGIDAPELKQEFGFAARGFLARLLVKHQVDVRPVEEDDYHRVVAHLEVDGKDVAHAVVQAGFAWHYRRYSSDDTLAAAERSAREGHLGLWAGSQPLAPWEFRKALRSSEVGPTASATLPLRGNSNSHVYHTSACSNYTCRNCTVSFASREEAERRGFHPCGECGR